jgi:hypothetical protein
MSPGGVPGSLGVVPGLVAPGAVAPGEVPLPPGGAACASALMARHTPVIRQIR